MTPYSTFWKNKAKGGQKAVELLSKGEAIFAWAPRLREWLKDGV